MVELVGVEVGMQGNWVSGFGIGVRCKVLLGVVVWLLVGVVLVVVVMSVYFVLKNLFVFGDSFLVEYGLQCGIGWIGLLQQWL